jgi:hypothetical protein
MNTPLTAAIKARDESAAEVDRLTEQSAKLERAISSASPAIAELASIRHQAAAEMEAWSAAGGEGKMPTADHGAIAKLEAEISAHASSIASAQAALQSVIVRREAARARHASVVKYVSINALLALVAEEDPKLIAEIETAQQTLLDLDATRTTLRKFLSGQADVIKERELYVALERMDAVRLTSRAGNADMAAINARLAELQTGANEKDA